MAKTSFASLKLKVKEEVKTFEVGDKVVEVKQYLPASDKYDLIMITLQESEDNGIYNAFKKDVLFHLNLVFMYTNLSFTDKQRENMLELYDILESNGIIGQVVDNIPEDEYELLLEFMEEVSGDMMNYKTSFSGTVSNIMTSLPQNAQAAADIVETFDPEKYQEVLNFARGIGAKI